MKKILFTLIALAAVFILKAQTVTPLTPKEVSERLIPSIRPAAFMPVAPTTYSTILEGRKKEKEMGIPKLTNDDSLDVKFINVPGLNTGDAVIPVRIYKPKNLTKAPVVLWCHGGGFVAGNLNWDHQLCANMALRSGVVVISVDYRLAPEHKYPAGVNDAYATLLWSIKHATDVGVDIAHIGVAGASAGAGIVGSLVLMAREKKGPKIDLQVLIFPPADRDTNRMSVKEFWNMPGVKGADIPVLIKMYTGIDNDQPLPDNVLPGLTRNFKGLPPTYVVTCGVDPLRDGGLAYAQKLIEAGIAVELHNYPGYPHGMLPDRCYPEMHNFIKQYIK